MFSLLSLLVALMSVKEMAKGIIYDDPIKTRYVFKQSVTFVVRFLLLLFITSYWQWILPKAGRHLATSWTCQKPGMSVSERSFTSWWMETPFLLRSKASERWSFPQVTSCTLSYTWQTHSKARRGPDCCDLLVTDLFSFVCSNSKRLEKEGHCSSHTNSNSRNPHSVSAVLRHDVYNSYCYWIEWHQYWLSVARHDIFSTQSKPTTDDGINSLELEHSDAVAPAVTPGKVRKCVWSISFMSDTVWQAPHSLF